MRPLKLTLKNVFQHQALEYVFGPGVTGIVGRNGAGKSNFLEALYFAMTGKLGSGINKSEILNWSEGVASGTTIFDFEDQDQVYTLTRAVHSSAVTLEGGHLSKPLKNAEANAFMEGVYGMTFENLYEACWTPQGSLVAVLTMGHAQRVAFFQRLADVQRAEVLRGILLEEGLNKIPTYPDRTEEIQVLTTEIAAKTSEHGGIAAELTALTDMKALYDAQVAEAQRILALQTEAQWLANVQTSAQSLTMSRLAVDAFDKASGNLAPEPEILPPTPERDQAYQRALEQSATVLRRDQTEAEARAVESKLQTYRSSCSPELLQAEAEVFPVSVERVAMVQAVRKQAEVMARRDATAAKLKALLGSLPPAVPQPANNQAVLETMYKDLLGRGDQHKLAVDGSCPTCKRGYDFVGGDAGRAALLAEYQKVSQEYDALLRRSTAEQQAYALYLKVTNTLTGQISAAEGELTAIEQELEGIGAVVPDPGFEADNLAYRMYVGRQTERARIEMVCGPLTGQIQALRQALADIDAALARDPAPPFDFEGYARDRQAFQDYLRRQGQRQVLGEQRQGLLRAVTEAETVLQQVQAQPYAAAATRDQALVFQRNYAALLQSIAEKQQLGSALAEAVKIKTAQVQVLEQEQLRLSKVAAIRKLLEDARTVLHRDNLPKLVMQKLVIGLNSMLERYLSLFEVPYVARLNEEFDFLCDFDYRAGVPARTLSGGQKVALALAFKFALSELMANHVPLMVLDEPTVWLDDINKPKLVEVMTRVRRLSENGGGTSVLVATHEEMLKPACTRVFSVSERGFL